MVELDESNTGFVSSPKLVIISSIQHIPLFKNRDFLYQKYVVEGLHPKQIAREIFSSRQSVYRYLRHFNIPIREIDTVRGFHTAYGVATKGFRITANRTELAIIERIKDLRGQGYSYDKIAHHLTTMGIPTKQRKGSWKSNSVRRILMRAESGKPIPVETTELTQVVASNVRPLKQAAG